MASWGRRDVGRLCRLFLLVNVLLNDCYFIIAIAFRDIYFFLKCHWKLLLALAPAYQIVTYQSSEMSFIHLLESQTNAKGILQEVWDTYKGNESPDTLREDIVFRLQSRFTNVIQVMGTPANFGNNYAQKLIAYLKVKKLIRVTQSFTNIS